MLPWYETGSGVAVVRERSVRHGRSEAKRSDLMARAHSPVEDVIRTRVEEHPDAVWLKFRDATYTWSEVLSNIQRAANGLLDLGVRPGERVAILMGNRPEFIWVHLGIVFIGALSVPSTPRSAVPL
jgi:acyl-CoA synthetase (AMP-forming)/AMP-acid ligase II